MLRGRSSGVDLSPCALTKHAVLGWSLEKEAKKRKKRKRKSKEREEGMEKKRQEKDKWTGMEVHAEGGHRTGSPKRECWRSPAKGRAGPLD